MNTSRRHPRTLQEAFGPYTSPHIYESRRSSPWALVAYAVAFVAACFIVGAGCAGKAIL